jgi:hypothetical protein
MDWFTEQVAQYARCYPIKGIALSTHGATFVGVGKDGKPSMPCVYYTHEPGDAFHARFYARFGSLEVLQEETGFQYFCLGTPVKTAIFLGGQEFKAWSCLLMNMHGQQELPRFDLYSVPFPAH